MSDDLLNILSGSNKDIDNQKLMDYLSDKLSTEEKHAFEENMAGSEMLNDVVEGLENIEDKKHLSDLVAQLNTTLTKQLEKKKAKQRKREIKNLNTLYLAIVLILIIILIGFLVIKKYLETDNPRSTPTPQRQSVSLLQTKTHSEE